MTYNKVNCNTYPNNKFDMVYLLFVCYLFYSFAKQFGHDDWQGYSSFIHWWTKRYGIVNKAFCGMKESATQADELERGKKLYFFLPLKATPQ